MPTSFEPATAVPLPCLGHAQIDTVDDNGRDPLQASALTRHVVVWLVQQWRRLALALPTLSGDSDDLDLPGGTSVTTRLVTTPYLALVFPSLSRMLLYHSSSSAHSSTEQ